MDVEIPTPPQGAQAAGGDAVVAQQLDEYKSALAALDRHFTPMVNVVAERYKFRQRSQLPGESIDSYIVALKVLASTCQFTTFHDEMI